MLFYFNFRLLQIYFKDFFLILPFFLFSFFFWTFFIKNNFFTVRINPSNKDLLVNSKFLKKVHYIFMLNWITYNFIYFFIFFYFIKTDFNVFWFNHLKFNNFNLNVILIILIFSLIILILIKTIKNSNVNYNIDYFFSIVNLICFVPLIFLTNTIITFLFVLELISLIILYKFSVSRTWFKKKSFNFDRLLPKSYLNMIFFQYWANFFSSMFIMFSVFSILFIFGSLEWSFIEVITNSNNNNNYFYSYNLIFIYTWTIFFIGLFLKIGFTPLHLFKIEVYKGIPFISIFFYTTWYFLSFFLFFSIIIFNNLYSLKMFLNIIFFVFINVGLFYSINLLFDVNLLKSFFAYSTIVNATNFIVVLYLSIN